MVSRKKPFGCSVCHLSFRLAKSLVKHVAIHNASDVISVPKNKNSDLQKTEKKFEATSEETSTKPSENSKTFEIKVQNSILESPSEKEIDKIDVNSVPGSKSSIQSPIQVVLKSKKYIGEHPCIT